MSHSAQPGPPIQLSLQQIEFYQREGYLALEGLCPADELPRLREIYDELYDQSRSPDSWPGGG